MNKRIKLIRRPEGQVNDSDFAIVEEPISLNLKQGEVFVRNEWLSIDPAQRVWIAGNRFHMMPVEINELVKSIGVGYIVDSRSPAFKKGHYVMGFLGWQEFSTIKSSELLKLPSYENPQLYLGVLGIPGLAAYFAVTEIAKPHKKEVLVVSSAAGALGSVACQIGKIRGCKVIGICGSNEKMNWLMNQVKIDGCINYNTEKSVSAALRRLCPEGIDVYIDNVGGGILDAVLSNIRKNARIVFSGAISGYNHSSSLPVHNYPVAIAMSATIEGFVVWDYQNRFELAIKQLSRWVQEKKLIFKEHVIEGLEKAPTALRMVMAGENFGKMVVKVIHDQPRI